MTKPDISWDYYRSFLAVLTEGSLSAAARSLGLTQPTLGRHIDALSEQVGFALFTRSPAGLKPTEAALNLQPYAQSLAFTAQALQRVASGQGQALKGTVRIGCSDVIGVEVLPPILKDLGADYLDIEIELSLSDSVEDLLQREVDIAIRMADPAQDALLAQKVGPVHLGLFAHADYLARHPAPTSLDDLHRHRLIGPDRNTAYVRLMTERHPQLALLSQLTYTYRTDSNLAQLAAIRAGIGIGFCQKNIARRDPALVAILPDSIDIPLPAFVAMHENLKHNPRYQLVFQELAKRLKAAF